MWLVFIFIFLILGIIFSKIEIIIKKIIITKNESSFEINVRFMFFGVIKLFSIKFDKTEIIFLGKIFSYEKLRKNKKFKIKYDSNIFDFKYLNQIFKEINLKLSSAKFVLRVGADDIFITSFLVVIFSSYITSFLKDKIHLMNSKKFNYRIFPEFNKSEILFEGNAVFQMRFKDLRKFLNLNEKV